MMIERFQKLFLSALTVMLGLQAMALEAKPSRQPKAYLSRMTSDGPADTAQKWLCDIDFENRLVIGTKIAAYYFDADESWQKPFPIEGVDSAMPVPPSKSKSIVALKPLSSETLAQLKVLYVRALQRPRLTSDVYVNTSQPIKAFTQYAVMDGRDYDPSLPKDATGYLVRDFWMIHPARFETKVKTCETQKMVELMDEVCNSVVPGDVWKNQPEQKPTGLCTN